MYFSENYIRTISDLFHYLTLRKMFTMCALCIFVGLSIYYFLWWEDNSKEPPGPKPWPIIGNLLDLANASDNLTLSMGILAEKYGEIYSLKMGLKKTVILTSMEAMHTIFVNEAAFGRDTSGMSGDRILHKNLGIASSNGKMWEKTRTWTFRTLKDFGFGKSLDMERFVKTASQSLFADIDNKIETQRGVIEIDRYFNSSILAIMWKMIVGRIIPDDEPNMEAISEKGHAFMRSGVLGMGVVSAYPFLRHIFPKTLGYNVQMDYFRTCNRVGKHLFLEMENQLNSSYQLTSHHNSLLETFVKHYITGNDPELFNCENFQIIFQDLLLASTDTSATFMGTIVLYLVAYPAVQEKVYQEIVRVSQNGRNISYLDRKDMPYTQAYLLETHRKGRMLQNLLPRVALSDIPYKNYIIKKGTIIICDTRLYYEDTQRWGDPEEFRPERFIGENGELINASSVTAFSFGKRNCPGELHANIVAFLMLASLLQKYRLSVPDGDEIPRLDMMAGITLKPHPFKAKFMRR